ncbi:hypothetical protein NSU_2780 [Novosphingobium pentaromativorans US6-1]|uniref:Uncharacterized protein n=1 Tax=Novosphingobium pentaromativorans US6-1 TaxID=1088721 RepID=G6EEK9_9SPHN|nr:hypothetical protein NSU_2780 [Novosphingobium pentaromativorans US6-1]
MQSRLEAPPGACRITNRCTGTCSNGPGTAKAIRTLSSLM